VSEPVTNRAAGPAVWALVPLKNLARAKSSLAPALGPERRRALVLAMAADVLAALEQVAPIERVLLVSNEPEAGRLLGGRRPEVFYSADREGLNRELEQAAAYAASQGARRALMLHADLPWLDAETVRKFLSGCPGGVVCAAQDKSGTGTNAIIAPLPLQLPLVFGVQSLEKFRAEARARGLDLSVVNEPALAQDVDAPEDYARLQQSLRAGPVPGAATRSLLEADTARRAGQRGRNCMHGHRAADPERYP